MHIKYKGKHFFECKMCSKRTNQMYSHKPHPAIVDLLLEEDRKEINICEICARRELGSKSREWKDTRRNL